MASSNAHHVLLKSLRNEQPRGGGNSSASTLAAVKSETLEMVNEKAMRHAYEMSKKKPKSHFLGEEKIDKMLHGMSPDDAKELAYQAREQMTFLTDVHSRVQKALDKTKDLFVQEELPPDSDVDPKSWVENSRRMLNRKMFLYNESCEERQQQLSGFCEWFELYENIWPLPLVGSEAQYTSFLGKAGPKGDNETDESAIPTLLPQMSKMREDLSHIMSATTQMGQKALGLELRKELQRLNEVIRDLQDQLDVSHKKLEVEKKTVTQKEAELSKHRHMHETVLNSRLAEIKELTEDKSKLKEDIEKLTLQHAQILADTRNSLEARIEQEQENQRKTVMLHKHEIQQLETDNKIKVEACQSTIQDLHVTITQLEVSAHQQDLQLQDREQQIGSLSASVADLKREQASLERNLLKVKEELKEEKENPYVKSVESHRDALESEKKTLLVQIQENQVAYETLRQTSESITQILETKDTEITNQMGEIVRLNQELSKRETEHEKKASELKSEISNLALELEKQTEINHNLETELLEIEKDLDSKIQTITALSLKMNKAAKKATNLVHYTENLRFQNEELKLVVEEKTAKHNQILAYLQALQVEVIEQRATFSKELDAMSQSHINVLQKLETEVKDLRDYKAARFAVIYANAQMQTELAEFLESQHLEQIAQIESAAMERIVKRFISLREKVTDVRTNFEREVVSLKETVRQVLKTKDIPFGTQSALNAGDRETEIQDFNRFFELSVGTMIELEKILAGVDSFMTEPPIRAGSISSSVKTANDLEPLLALASRKSDLPLVETNFDFSRIHKLQPLPEPSSPIRPLSRSSSSSGNIPTPFRDLGVGASTPLRDSGSTPYREHGISSFGGNQIDHGFDERRAKSLDTMPKYLSSDSLSQDFESQVNFLAEQEKVDNLVRVNSMYEDASPTYARNAKQRSSSITSTEDSTSFVPTSKVRTPSSMPTLRMTDSRLSRNETRSNSRMQDVSVTSSSRPNTSPDTPTSYHFLHGWNGNIKDEGRRSETPEASFPDDIKLPQARIGDVWFQGFRPSKTLKVLPENESDFKPRIPELNQGPMTTVEVINLIHTVEPLPSLPLTANMKKLEEGRKSNMIGQLVSGPISEQAWLKIQGMKPSSKAKTFTA